MTDTLTVTPLLSTPTGKTMQEVPPLSMGQMLLEDETYSPLLDKVNDLNQTRLMFVPDWHTSINLLGFSRLYYCINGTVSMVRSSMPAGGPFTLDFRMIDTVDSIAQKIASQCWECQQDAENDLRDSKEYRQQLNDYGY